jgi:hypothetical protein
MRKKATSEYKLILSLSRLYINSAIAQEIKEIIESLVDWNAVITLSNRHGVVPFLYYNINKLSLQNILPPPVITDMKNCYYSNLNKNIYTESEIFSVLERINSEGISAVPIKGFSLIHTLYNNHALRIMADIDILIKKESSEKIRPILLESGYS